MRDSVWTFGFRFGVTNVRTKPNRRKGVFYFGVVQPKVLNGVETDTPCVLEVIGAPSMLRFRRKLQPHFNLRHF
jgi:hypothetical protein